MLQTLWKTHLYHSAKISKQSVSSAQCVVTITSFSFILPNLTDGSRSHEGISAPHPMLSLFLSLHFSVSLHACIWHSFPHSFFLPLLSNSFSFLFLLSSHSSYFLLHRGWIMILWQCVAMPSWGGSVGMSRVLLWSNISKYKNTMICLMELVGGL